MATKKTQTHAQAWLLTSNENRQGTTGSQTTSPQRSLSTNRQTQRALRIWQGYSFLISPFKAWAVSQTGIIHHCHHQPSCGVFMARQIAAGNWRGIKIGIKRFLACR